MTEKSKHLGVDTGKSSTRFFGGRGKAVPPRDIRTPATGSNNPATGDGHTVNKRLIGKIAAAFLPGKKK